MVEVVDRYESNQSEKWRLLFFIFLWEEISVVSTQRKEYVVKE